MSDDDWGSLIDRLNGDHVPWNEFFARVLRVALPFYGRSWKREDAEDLSQALCVQLYEKRGWLHSYDRQRPFRPFLIAIASNRNKDALHARAKETQRYISYDDLRDQLQAPSPLDGGPSAIEIESALKELDPRSQFVVRLKLAGLTAKEIGKIMELSPYAVDKAFERACDKLWARLFGGPRPPKRRSRQRRRRPKDGGPTE